MVADGLGGHGGGEKASRAAAECVQELWSGAVSETELAALVQAAHGRVLSMQTRACAMKTTITVLALGGGRAAWTHVGDSRIYHFHNGSLVFQTRDHSASQIAVMLGNITPDQIRFHEDRARIYRALGQDGELKVETHARRWKRAPTPSSCVRTASGSTCWKTRCAPTCPPLRAPRVAGADARAARAARAGK